MTPVERAPRWSPSIIALAVGAIAGLLVLFALMLLPASVFDVVVEEDGAIETLGAAGLAAAVVFCLLALRRERARRSHWFKQLTVLGLAAFFFLSAGEEISWGQRILGYGTPEKIDRVNGQGEFNVHNLTALGSLPELAFFAVWFGLAVVIPLAFAFGGPPGLRLANFVPVLPLAFPVMFACNQALAKLAIVFYGNLDSYQSIYPVTHAVTEIKEAGYEVMLGLAAWWVWRAASPGSTGGPVAVDGVGVDFAPAPL